MSRYTGKGKCAQCGGQVPPRVGYWAFAKYCSSTCRKRATSNSWAVGPCPVEGCQQELGRSRLATCTSCWARVPLRIQRALADAWIAYRQAGVSEQAQALLAFEECRESAVAAAGGLLDELEAKKRRAQWRLRQGHGRAAA